MHEDARAAEGIQIAVLDLRKEAGEFVLQARIHRDAAVLGDVPVGKELQLARQQSGVVSRQHAGA